MRTLCAWCRAVMNPGAGPDDPNRNHGMCADCEQRTDAERDGLVTNLAPADDLGDLFTGRLAAHDDEGRFLGFADVSFTERLAGPWDRNGLP